MRKGIKYALSPSLSYPHPITSEVLRVTIGVVGEVMRTHLRAFLHANGFHARVVCAQRLLRNTW
jgi:hypothetical protein